MSEKNKSSVALKTKPRLKFQLRSFADCLSVSCSSLFRAACFHEEDAKVSERITSELSGRREKTFEIRSSNLVCPAAPVKRVVMARLHEGTR